MRDVESAAIDENDGILNLNTDVVLRLDEDKTVLELATEVELRADEDERTGCRGGDSLLSLQYKAPRQHFHPEIVPQ